MNNTLVVVFTENNDDTRSYLESMGLDNFSSQSCPVAAITYSSGGECVNQNITGDADVLLVSDDKVDNNTKNIVESYVDKSEKVAVVYHIGARESIVSHKSSIQDICEGKEVCSESEHSTVGNTFECLTKIADSIKQNDERQYEKSVNRIIRYVCGDPILETKLDLLHRLLVPPAGDSGDWKEIKEDWSVLMELVKDDPEEKEKYKQAWKEFRDQDPQKYSADPFNEKYCGSEDEEGMLEELRDELLS